MVRYITDFEQNTDEWKYARLGKFTGSDFHVFLGESKTKTDKLWEKISELLLCDTDEEEYFNPYMERGHVLEPEARRFYSFSTGNEVKEVGLAEEDGEFDGWVVCSPDGLVGDDGIIEIKCLSAKFFLQYTKDGKNYVRPEHKTQCQFNMFVTGRQWCDLVYYHPRLGMHIIRLEKDDEYIEKIKTALRSCIQFITDNIN